MSMSISIFFENVNFGNATVNIAFPKFLHIQNCRISKQSCFQAAVENYRCQAAYVLGHIIVFVRSQQDKNGREEENPVGGTGEDEKEI